MVGFDDIFNLTRLLNTIESSIFRIQTHFNGVRLVALFYDSDVGSDEKKVKKKFYERSKERIDELNRLISVFNNLLNTKFKHLRAEMLVKVNLKSIKKIINEHKDNSHLGRRHTHLKLNNTLIPLLNSEENFLKSLDDLYLPFGGPNRKFKTPKKVRINIKEAFDVYSIGYLGTSVFIIGKTLEMVITDYLKELKKCKKINYTMNEINSWNFDTKINILKKEKLLAPNQYSKMMSVKWDRNIFGHPSKKTDLIEAKNDADAIIKIGVNMIQLIENRIYKLK